MRVRGREKSPEDLYRVGGVNDDRRSSRGKNRGQWDGWGLEEPGKRPLEKFLNTLAIASKRFPSFI